MVLKSHGGLFEINEALVTLSLLYTVFVANVQNAAVGLAHGTWPFQPFFRADDGGAIALGTGVVLPKYWAPPTHHLLFDFYRTGCCCMNGALVAAQVVALAYCRVQFQHAHKHGGHPLGVGNLIVLNELQG